MAARTIAEPLSTERVPEPGATGTEAADACDLSRAGAARLLEAMTSPAMIVGDDRRIVATNGMFRRLVGTPERAGTTGLRPGEAMHCTHADETPQGCGGAPQCPHCGQLAAFLDCTATRRRVVKEATLQTRLARDGGALEFRVHATPLTLEGAPCVVLGLEDIRSERRRLVLERALFQDAREVCEAIFQVAGRLRDPAFDAAELAEHAGRLEALGERVADLIDAQHQLHLAERGQLELQYENVSLPGFVRDIVEFHRGLPIATGRTLKSAPVPDGVVYTDRGILRRVLRQLVTNALEATAEGGTVTLSCGQDDAGTRFAVHNPDVIPRRARLQLFKRAYTTRPEPGRGVGLHYARMLVDDYLDGELDFTSEEGAGTTFEVLLRH